MATNKRKTTSFSFDQITEVAGQVPGRLDAFRAESFAGLGKVKRAKLVQSRRERARLEAKHGAGHTLVVEADRRMANEHRMLVNSRIEHDRISTLPIERAEKVWQLHGYVHTREGVAVAKATVALYPDPDGNQTAVAETMTDSKGYFKISVSRESWAAGLAADIEAAEEPQSELGLLRRDLSLRTNVETQPQRLASGLRINARIRDTLAKEPVYVGARPSGGELTMVTTPLYPAPATVAYRDIVLAKTGQGGEGCQLRTRLLGNSASRELHDLSNEKSGCQIEEIRPDHRIYFRNEAEAEQLGYDYCAYCYGKSKSRR